MIKLLRTTTKEQWSNSLYWFVFTSIGGLIPLWVGAIILRFLSSWPGWSYFIINGEFTLYSAALLAPSLHILIKESKKPGFRFMVVLCFILLIISAIIYATVFIGTTAQLGFTVIGKEESTPVDLVLLKTWSIIIFIASCIISFFAVLLENVKADPNVEGMRTQELNDLEKSFNTLNKGGRK